MSTWRSTQRRGGRRRRTCEPWEAVSRSMWSNEDFVGLSTEEMDDVMRQGEYRMRVSTDSNWHTFRAESASSTLLRADSSCTASHDAKPQKQKQKQKQKSGAKDTAPEPSTFHLSHSDLKHGSISSLPATRWWICDSRGAGRTGRCRCQRDSRGPAPRR